MRLSTSALFSTALVLFHFSRAIFAQTSSALTLSTFQQINGFSPVCTQAYNTPLTDCSTSDFSGHGCSAKCIGFLDDLTNLLNTACAGTSSYPNTLIALFFSGEGTQTLCSNAGENSSSRGGAIVYGQEGGQDGASTTQVAATEGSTSTTSTSITSTTSTTSTTSVSTSSTTSTSSTLQAAATSSTTTVISTTVTPQATTTSVSIVGTTVTPESSSDASTSSSHTKSSTSSSGTSTSTSNDNGGGTPLDIGSSACHDAVVTGWLLTLIAGSAGVAWLL